MRVAETVLQRAGAMFASNKKPCMTASYRKHVPKSLYSAMVSALLPLRICLSLMLCIQLATM